MSKNVNLGGDRLGSGKKNDISLHGYQMSTHDKGYVFRSTMASGTLVPFLMELGTPGDNFEINLEEVIKTLPTVGPLFGTFKTQVDVFRVPIRLYHSRLHNNPLGIGLKMNTVQLPQLYIEGNSIDETSDVPYDIQQVNPSSVLNYLGIKGFGNSQKPNFPREFNAVPYLAYFDIYKNYYANKQEEIGVIIHNDIDDRYALIERITTIKNGTTIDDFIVNPAQSIVTHSIIIGDNLIPNNASVEIKGTNLQIDDMYGEFEQLAVYNGITVKNTEVKKYKDVFAYSEETYEGVRFHTPIRYGVGWSSDSKLIILETDARTKLAENKPNLKTFPLENVDKMRELILSIDGDLQFQISDKSMIPYCWPFKYYDAPDEEEPFKKLRLSCSQTQEGLLVKTYQSDIFNNWLNTEWLDGENGINEITSIDTSEGSFTMDTLNLSKKVYDMLNRIAVSGGTYKDWIESVYDSNAYFAAEIPEFMGGMSKELIFTEVISQYGTEETKPLGSIAGKGTLIDGRGNGKIFVKCNEPCYIIGLVSLTPRIDYSQGNDWTTSLKTLDDLHKPALDGIGFQDLLCENMAQLSTYVDNNDVVHYKSAGKIPAWLWYMTNHNRVHGNFADERNQMYMVLNRRYEYERVNPLYDGDLQIKDLTTYIDPSKYNYIFAQTELDAQNFWVQIGIRINKRGKISAKQIPNL